jgi:hypothetical protein
MAQIVKAQRVKWTPEAVDVRAAPLVDAKRTRLL